MTKLAMCRICLIEDVRMHPIINTNLQETYEILTGTLVEAGASCSVCVWCAARLHDCRRLRHACLRSRQLLTDALHHTKFEPTQLQCMKTLQLVCSPITHLSIEPGPTEVLEVDIKQEPLPTIEDVQVKQEHHEEVDIKVEDSSENGDMLDYRIKSDTEHSSQETTVNGGSHTNNDTSSNDVQNLLYRTFKIVLQPRDGNELPTRNNTECEYGSSTPAPSANNKIEAGRVRSQGVTSYTRRYLTPPEAHPHPADKQSPRLNKTPKTSAERAREFRARKRQSKQQQQLDAIVEIATGDTPIAGPSHRCDTIEKRARSAEATRRWRDKQKGDYEKKQAKTAAQRMREYRARKKLAKKMLLQEQSDQD